jgi:opacity protein-like surface antigen
MDLDLNQVLRPLTMAADVRGQEGRTSRDGIRRLDASLNNIQGIDDLAARYRFSEREEVIAKAGSFSAIPYAGVRFIDMRYDLVVQFEGPRLSASRSRSFGGTVAQPLIGTQAMVFLTPPLRLFARGDIGGFGVNNSDDYSANAQVGLGDAVGNNTQLNLSWRYMHLGGTNDQSPENAYSINQNGVELGAKFLF